MELVYKYRESLKEYTVEENDFYYYMPYSYVMLLEDHLKDLNSECDTPIEDWYMNLKDLEKKVVYKRPKDQDKISSIW